MGYTTEFRGRVSIDPPLSAAEVSYLRKFAETRRMDRANGPYYVDGGGDLGQAPEPDVRDYNTPPTGQPGLWCQWVPTDDGTAIRWDGSEKFYHSEEWMRYLIEHFVGSNPLAQRQLPFLQPHVLNGEIVAQGEHMDDRWKLVVEDNVVTRVDLE